MAQRVANRESIAKAGVSPYGRRVDGLSSIADAKALFDPDADMAYKAAVEAAKAAGRAGSDEPVIEDPRPVVRVAGRVMLRRSSGKKLVWLQLRDHTSGPETLLRAQQESADDQPASDPLLRNTMVTDLQVALSNRDLEPRSFEIVQFLDIGDVVVVEGPLTLTNMGEITVWARHFELGCKSLNPPPEKWSGLRDVELRYRRRYIDLYANPETMQVFKLRSQIIARARDFLSARGYIEAETPVLQPQAGGAAARPFPTHLNALDVDLFMRIAPELYLKRLLVGGVPRVFEFSRNFRNEGIDRNHNPEFTSLEVYEAFGNFETMRELAETLLRDIATFVAGVLGGPPGDLRLPFGEWTIDYGAPFEHVTYNALFERALGYPPDDLDAVRRDASARGIKLHDEGGAPLADVLVVNELFERYAEPTLDPSRPTFVLEYPAALSPLTRPKASDPNIAERWDLFIGGMEVGPAYTELNDPDVQAAMFRQQLVGLDDEESTFRNFDEDFIKALEVGMPPAGGLGLGIDRVCMLMLNQRSIRDVILFPMMRPTIEQGHP